MPSVVSRRPLVGLAIVFVCGTLAGFAFPFSFGQWACAALVLAAPIAFLSVRDWRESRLAPPSTHARGRQPLRVLAGGLLFLETALIAAASAALWVFGPGPDAVVSKDGRYHLAEVIGIISDDPGVDVSPDKGRPRFRFPLNLEAGRALPDGTWQRVTGEIQIRTYGPIFPTPRYGDRWLISGSAARKAVSLTGAPGRSRYVCFAAPRRSCLCSGGHGSSIIRACFSVRKSAGAVLRRGIEHHREAIAILDALILGYRRALPDEIRDDFRATGTLHIFAISGLHVAMIATMLIYVLATCGISRVHWVLVLTPVLIGYTIATGMSPSAVRSCIMAIVFFAAPLIRREADAASALGLSAILILATGPGQVFDLGFILSFSAVIGLITIYPPLYRALESRLRPDPLRIQPERRWVTGLRWLVRAVWALLAASFAASLATAPITACFFNNVAVIGLLGNLLAVPFSFLVVLTGCLSLVFGSAIAVFAEVFNHANLLIIGILTRSMGVLADVPGSHFTVRAPSWWQVVLWYAVLAIAVAIAKPGMDKSGERR